MKGNQIVSTRPDFSTYESKVCELEPGAPKSALAGTLTKLWHRSRVFAPT